MSGFAQTTGVSPEKTRAEIEATLRRYGAASFASGWDSDRAYVAFKARDRFIRFTIVMPDRTDRRFSHNVRGQRRTAAQEQAEYDQAVRSLWRRLLLCIKAKLESVQTGIETLEEAFLAQIVLPDQTTVGQWAAAAIPAAYATGDVPRVLLSALPPGR